jgi:hypothetical protein
VRSPRQSVSAIQPPSGRGNVTPRSNKLTFAGERPIEGLRLWYLRIQKRGVG